MKGEISEASRPKREVTAVLRGCGKSEGLFPVVGVANGFGFRKPVRKVFLFLLAERGSLPAETAETRGVRA